MAYHEFAYYYDLLMSDVPYDKWEEFVSKQIEKYKISGKQLLDLGCGTGSLAIPFARKGYDVTGMDLSIEMLAIANNKARHENCNIHFVEQDMREFESHLQYDIIGIFCDSLNYLQSKEDVLQTFKKVYDHLQDDGLFIFDVHSEYKINHIFNNYSYGSNEENFSFIWNCFEGSETNSIEHELTFFVESKEGEYSRFDELHMQRTFALDTYKTLLKEAGFNQVKVTADFSEMSPVTDSERIFFTVKKT
ncbi:SAM-dependent methyltransferase [Lottiidibacillus patelloidae]|uniref:SAM-dependent methyltransferase n=1 Tax=Lottiidibacillus patelloidae TaxID=2670334 RepID=A0A263BW16_9BACI|nr:class I SAM-dependent methyltransferase [Lottiidibacillus patelloidae]OZM57768.1 SAM-dependent methyltransferase [Lottiidibacillus patelloidae]